ncbi:ABC-F family ATP-binding cassette domain-containing protein [Heyndrickxia oleronia]|jgi:ATP-binding cassette subfamily F protein 3|uniref:Multidrug ABC transporter ATP-binding protein n=1 Tax=Heyndrickxia oleronia TaxID=38875 RepID=A0A8E2LE95_9BACI|nr:ABC-F family ATP-binding cassette domain-containing protein [Heyndrickxia oleronia]MCI1591771.1 ABC-F family ATP-binding cassette domain-containing protein [Heyndrickxia oleronia]MCI1614971.1 ABC-F family ATP-binding cassette domain-containing protein [Heyndrickxia oleronia]MCI1745838.1 ABC-F family ATP-binding cassette domain-containing protein [Heyndrickxia oleronia]MCI1764144.1 ABC-F family ATP-binding cassette domain-containing protein [Heyndrickxia oleronia]MEC1377252.1 ABC-F family AT
MILLQVQQLTKHFGAELILSNIKLEIQTRDRIALVGRNGAGKSTLLKIISGQLSLDSGEIMKPKDVSIGYLAQNTGLESSLSIWDEMLTVFKDLQKMETQLRELEQKIADPTYYENPDLHQKILSEYDRLQVKFKDSGGYQYEADIRSVLHGLRFDTFDYSTMIETLSGGQKTRLALAKLLLTKPDVLILDEPTNHLDIDTLSWLEQYLQGYDGAILIVSHDRYFLDKVVNQVYELSRHSIQKFHGNYSQYLVQKAEQYERDFKQYEKQQEEVAKLQDFIQRNLARASTTKRAQSRRKQLEKMTIMDKPLGDEKSANFTFDIERQSGNEVLNLVNGAIGYEDNIIAKGIQLAIKKGDSIALVGPNGVGKSTLLKSIIKKLTLLSGNISYGSNVTIGYYDQEQANLTSNKTVLNELWDDYPLKDEKEIRTVLGNFLFTGDDVLKTVSSLSGGEKARLALSKLLMQRANFLILDEPTNHLDLDSKEVLENALIDYPGTILFVSHDRYFINRLATKVIELSKEGTTEFLGDYDYYIEKQLELLELKRLKNEGQKLVEDKPNTARQSYQLDKEAKKLERQRKRRIEEIESTIEQYENELQQKEELLCDPNIYQDHEKVTEINDEIEKLKTDIDELMSEWAEIEESNE